MARTFSIATLPPIGEPSKVALFRGGGVVYIYIYIYIYFFVCLFVFNKKKLI